MRRGAFANLMVIGALIVAGCSSDNGAQAPSTVPITTTTSSSVAPTTTAAPTTTTTTTSRTTVGTTAAPSTPTSFFSPPGRNELDDLYRRYYAIYQACLDNPPTCDRVALAQVADPTVQAAVLQIVDQSAAAGEKRRPGQQANYFSLEDIVPAGDGRSGTVKVCEFDGSLRYNATSESVVEDRVSSFEIVYTGQQATDGWRVVGVEEVNRWIGVNQCGPPTP